MTSVSVKDGFGVKGAPYDDTSPLQAAIDSAAAAGKYLYFPPGVYRYSSLVLRNNTRILGAGGGIANTKGAILRKIGPSSGLTLESGPYAINIMAEHIALDQEDASGGDLFDFSAATQLHNFNLFRVSAILKNPAARIIKSLATSVCKSRLQDVEFTAAPNATARAVEIIAPSGHNIFNFVVDGMTLTGDVNNNTVPLMLVADDYGAVSFGVEFRNIVGEPGPGGLIEARGLYAGPVFDNVSSADCDDTWPIVHLTKGLSSVTGYGAATFNGCFLHNVTADAIAGCHAPSFYGGYLKRLVAPSQINRPLVVGTDIRILDGDTSPIYLA